MFINRESELNQLSRHYNSKRAEFFVLYGRRRVGKTQLLRTFCEKKSHVFFVATLSSDRDQLASFSQEVWQATHAHVPEGFTFPSWDAAFQALAELPERSIVVIDEFTYLVNGNRALPSILQKVWDEKLQGTDLFLVVCGSYVGMMEKAVLSSQAALYGRRTGSLFLQPLELPAAAAFFPAYPVVEQIEAWSVLGGMPYYLQVFSDNRGLFQNIRDAVLHDQGLLFNEPHLLLMEELREPRNYFSILRAIAHGKTKLNDIAQSAQVGDGRITARYLETLKEMRLVTRNVPATEAHPEKSKKGLYEIADSFLRFWFRFVHPYRGSLQLGLADPVLEHHVRPHFNHYVGHAFEIAARAHIARLGRAGELPFIPERIGGYWSRGTEIDVVAVSDTQGACLVGECKWSDAPVGLSILTDLRKKAAAIEAMGRWPRTAFALFSKKGFTRDLKDVAAREGVILVGPKELVAVP